jgi:hypothetical protein
MMVVMMSLAGLLLRRRLCRRCRLACRTSLRSGGCLGRLRLRLVLQLLGNGRGGRG